MNTNFPLDPWIELRVWRQFLILAEELHFGRAAQRLHMTQPPLTQAIAGLERSLACRLFERSKRRVELTAAGAALLPVVRELLTAAQALPARAQAAAAGEAGRLRLAFVSTVGFELLPRWIRAFRVAWPQVALELIEATGDVQLPLLGRGGTDASFMLHAPGFAPSGLSRLRVAVEPLVLALPESHPLASAKSLPIKQVLAEPIVCFPRRILPSVHDALFALYHAAGTAPRIEQEAIQMQTIVNLVAAGLGVAWVPESVREFQRRGVCYRRVGGATARGPLSVPVCETSLVWRDPATSPTLARFIEFAKAQSSPC